ncbi:hypothetical protein AD40_1324 [Escherichia coli 1-392-07_S4_C3]|nr:hypothetical protein AD40_1324 [Escherichia coli 1-392-07_S4_C3]
MRSRKVEEPEKLLPVSWAAEHIETSARIQAVDGRRLS